MRPSRQPAHTRTLTVRLAPAGRGRLAIDARLLDVRERGVVEAAGCLSGPGVVHDLLAMMQPVVFQAMPALPAPGDAAGVPQSRRSSAARDSCAMWRQDGPLVRAMDGEARGRTQ